MMTMITSRRPALQLEASMSKVPSQASAVIVVGSLTACLDDDKKKVPIGKGKGARGLRQCATCLTIKRGSLGALRHCLQRS